MRVELAHQYTFEAAHRLPMVPREHKCYRVHGHSYRVEVCVAGEVDERMGWLVDFGDISAGGGAVLPRGRHHGPRDLPRKMHLPGGIGGVGVSLGMDSESQEGGRGPPAGRGAKGSGT